MRCLTVKEKLDRYLAGECRLYEKKAVKKHLSRCPECSAELQSLRKLDLLLDQWQTGPAPPELWGSIMAQVEAGPVDDSSVFRPQRHPWSLLRDLAVAAAVTLALCWNIGSWFGGGQLLAAGKSVNGAVVAYTRVTDDAFNRLTETAGNCTQKLFFEEW